MAANREDIFEEKPTLCELSEHIHIGSKWYQLGIMLKLDVKKLNDIQKLQEDSTHKTSKMFEFWLDNILLLMGALFSKTLFRKN